MWNLHVADTTNNPPPGMPNHDPLAKVWPLVTMCQNNFRLRYTPDKFLAMDESTLAFKVKHTISWKLMTLKIIPNIVNKYFIISITFPFLSAGRVRFLQFNPSKPNKFHFKLFMVSEHKTGYMCGFSVYTGKVANELLVENAVSTDKCTTTT